MVVPEYFSVGQAHDLVEDFGKQVMQATGIPGEFHSHVDPCRRLYCEECEVTGCPVRRVAMQAPRVLNVETATAAGPAED
jgi:hypothetical protein